MMRTTLFALVVLCLAGAVGCQEPHVPLEATRQAFVMADPAQLDELWDTCQTVLRRSRFRLDRVDRRSGTITTFPVTSMQFFEFWRHDVNSAYHLADASMHTVRRRAAIELEPADTDPLTVAVYVTVNVERLSAPERQFNNSAMALRFFGNELPGAGGQKQLRRADDYWVEQGRDAAMEGYLLGEIVGQGTYVELAEPNAP
jgi:hypothetical protein